MAICMGAETDRAYTSADLDQGRGAALGDVFFDTAGKVWKFVEYQGGGVAAVVGQVAYYAVDGHKNGQVTSDLSASVEVGAGVLGAAPANGEYCWIQIKGPATLALALTAGSDGDPLTPTGATDGTLDVTAAATSHVCAFAGDISDREIICDFPM